MFKRISLTAALAELASRQIRERYREKMRWIP